MAQKDKVKELVGRGLHSYHTKALQQIDRIEKKNKEQNHKISILSNELDNDYLTKTEEGSVVSLEHSKEGMVYLDELQGNTLVNYCTDGSKEMTLNGDIDLEGTFVTTTEGMDNGLVDVMCEGNTLVSHKGEQVVSSGNAPFQLDKEIVIKEYNTYIALCSTPAKDGEKIYFRLDFTKLSHNDLLNNGFTTSRGTGGYDNIIFTKEQIKEMPNNTRTTISTIRQVKGSEFPDKTEHSYSIGIKTLLQQDEELFRFKVHDYQIINLTQMFGKGNEPSVEWCDKNIPYFEGMKSVGQNDENGHKIEILSHEYKSLPTDKNGLVCHLSATGSSVENNIMKDLSGNDNNATLYGAYVTNGILLFDGVDDYASIPRCVQDDFTIMLKAEVTSVKGGSDNENTSWYNYAGLVDTESQGVTDDFGLVITKKGYPCVGIGNPDKTYKHNDGCLNNLTTFIYTRNKTTGDVKLYIDGEYSGKIETTNKNSLNSSLNIYIGKSGTKANTAVGMKFHELKIYNKVLNETDILKHNKKEILMNEPLRGLPNGVKDRFVKIGGKPYIERNCGYIFLDNTRNWAYNTGHNNPIFECSIKNDIVLTSDIIGDRLLCDKLESKAINSTNENYGICFVNGSICRIRINGYTTSEEYNNWINNNSLNVVYQLPTPVYEPLEIDSTLSCYSEVTHFSNNSIIPCNMKIQNSGYNAIIKPSTLYTIALDTNKSVTIGMNLGGVKGTTTNNVLKLTTPATLADDSLRIYGKGIKGSKVRLLEGDKTNWIPYHFEGMKSSFEDKLQDDGTYKMEILSNNRNLFDINGITTTSNNVLVEKNNDTLIISNESGQTKWQQHNIFIKGLQHNKTYLVNIGDLIIQNNFEQMDRCAISIYEETRNLHLSNVFDANKKQCRFSVPLGARLDRISLRIHLTTTSPMVNKITVKSIQISEVDSCIIDRQSNKIQFSSIEPLRKWDRFVFVNEKLMIERNTKVKNFMPTTIANTPLETYQLVRMSKTSDMYGYNNGYGNWTMMDKYSEFTALGDTWQLVERIGQYSTRISTSFIDIAFRLGSFNTLNDAKNYFTSNPAKLVYRTSEPTYEEIPFELQKIILEGYENGTLFFDTNIPPTSTVTYAGETPIVKSVKLNKTEVLNNTNDINDNIIPYLMDMDYRVVCLQLESNIEGISMARLFGGTYEMLKRDIQSNRLSKEEYGYRLIDYFNAGKLTEQEVRELEDLK